jgi:hypothetical protein
MAQSADEAAQPDVPAVAAQPAIAAQPAAETVPGVAAAAPVDPLAPISPDTAGTPGALAPAVTAVQAEPSLQPTASPSVEQRLQRLEKLVESIAVEIKKERVPPTARNNYRAAMEYGVGRYPMQLAAQNLPNATSPVRVNTAPSLSDLKKRRIDVEDHLARLQEELAGIDEQIAKMQSARSSNRYGGEKK